MKTVKKVSSLLQTLPVIENISSILNKLTLPFYMLRAACWSGCLRACVAGGAFEPPAAHVRPPETRVGPCGFFWGIGSGASFLTAVA